MTASNSADGSIVEEPERDLVLTVVSFHGGPEGQERPAFRSDYQGCFRRASASRS